MKHQDKKAIMEAAKRYCIENGRMSGNDLGRRANVNTRYLSYMMKGQFTYTNQEGNIVDIPVYYFERLARLIGYKLEEEIWPLVETPQFIEVITALTEAKEDADTRMIIGDTGTGKTYSVRKFAAVNPKGTYVVTCARGDNMSDFMRKIQRAMGVQYEGSINYQLDKINIELQRRSDSKEKPLIVFDEAELLTTPAFLKIKTIYDELENICGIALVGTSQLIDEIEKNQKKSGMEQFHSRFKAGSRWVLPVDRSYALFLQGRGYDKGFIECVQRNADEYRGLAKRLMPVLKEAKRLGVKPSVELFNTIHKLQYRPSC